MSTCTPALPIAIALGVLFKDIGKVWEIFHWEISHWEIFHEPVKSLIDLKRRDLDEV